MANLLDTIRNNTAAISNQKQGLTDQTGKLSALLRAKSGRDVSGGDVGSSNLGEAQAVTDTNNQMQNTVAPAAALQSQGEQIQGQAQEDTVNQQKADIAQSRRLDTIQSRLKTGQLLQDLEQNSGKLDQQRKDVMVNQAAQNLRLQNNQYTSTLQREGQAHRLDNQVNFDQALAKAVFGDNEELLKHNLNNKSILDANDREFNKAMTMITLNNAYDIYRKDLKSKRNADIIQGITGGATAIIGGKSGGGAPSMGGGAQTYGQAVDISQKEYASPSSDVNLMKSRGGY